MIKRNSLKTTEHNKRTYSKKSLITLTLVTIFCYISMFSPSTIADEAIQTAIECKSILSKYKKNHKTFKTSIEKILKDQMSSLAKTAGFDSKNIKTNNYSFSDKNELKDVVYILDNILIPKYSNIPTQLKELSEKAKSKQPLFFRKNFHESDKVKLEDILDRFTNYIFDEIKQKDTSVKNISDALKVLNDDQEYQSSLINSISNKIYSKGNNDTDICNSFKEEKAYLAGRAVTKGKVNHIACGKFTIAISDSFFPERKAVKSGISFMSEPQGTVDNQPSCRKTENENIFEELNELVTNVCPTLNKVVENSEYLDPNKLIDKLKTAVKKSKDFDLMVRAESGDKTQIDIIRSEKASKLEEDKKRKLEEDKKRKLEEDKKRKLEEDEKRKLEEDKKRKLEEDEKKKLEELTTKDLNEKLIGPTTRINQPLTLLDTQEETVKGKAEKGEIKAEVDTVKANEIIGETEDDGVFEVDDPTEVADKTPDTPPAETVTVDEGGDGKVERHNFLKDVDIFNKETESVPEIPFMPPTNMPMVPIGGTHPAIQALDLPYIVTGTL